MFIPLVMVALAMGQVPPVPSSVASGTATLGAPTSTDLVPVLPSGGSAANSSMGMPNHFSAAGGPSLPKAQSAVPTGIPQSLNSPYIVPNSSPGNSYGLPKAQNPDPLPTFQMPVYGYALQNGNPTATASGACSACRPSDDCFFMRLWKAYYEEFKGKGDKDEKKEDKDAQNGDKKKDEKKDDKTQDSQNSDAAKETYRRALPEPWSSPPFPGHEYQGYPLVGVPPSTDVYPLMNAIYGGPCGEEIKDSRVKLYGWVTTSGTWSNAQNSNAPTSYWVVPNRFELDQLIVRLEREPDTVQTDHIDWGFRSTGMYGQDYRYTTAGGWMSNQLLKENRLYGFDPIEQYVDVYVPGVFQGMVMRVGRWVACPDIETQLAPDNYLGSHSILFTFDTYTQTGVLFTFCLSDQWMVQGAIHSGTDMAPWYPGATPTGFFGLRWVGADNNDAVYTCLNNINNAEFRHFDVDGQPAGHDNYNYIVSTWEHRFSAIFHTKTEAYFMWQKDAEVGGTPSIGPLEPFGGGGGDGVLLPGWSFAYGVLNYSMLAVSDNDYFTFRSEWYRDERGMRTGFSDNYSSFTLGLSHNFNPVLQIRPEIGWYHAYDQPAFDNGTKKDLVLYGFDCTLRF